MPADGRCHAAGLRRRLQVEVDAHVERREVLERLVEGRRRRAERADAVREREDPVPAADDVELDHVDAELDGERERLERVLGRERRGAAMADAHDLRAAPVQLHRYARLTTTTAQSSPSSPPAYARHSSSTASASSWGASPRRLARSSSSRSVPKSSPPRRASTTPSV